MRLHEICQGEVIDERDGSTWRCSSSSVSRRASRSRPDERLDADPATGAVAGELMAQANTFAKRFDRGPYGRTDSGTWAS